MAEGSGSGDRDIVDSLVGEGSNLASALREATRAHEQWAARVDQQFETMLRGFDALTVERDELVVRLGDANAELVVMREEQEALWDQLRTVQQEAAEVVTHRDQLLRDNRTLSESLDAAQRTAAANDLKAYEAEERSRQAEAALAEAGQSHQAALMREAALADAMAALEKELDAAGQERDEMQLVRDGLEAQVEQAEAGRENLRQQLAARDAAMVAMKAELDASEEARVELVKRVEALQAELDRGRAHPAAETPADAPSAGDSSDEGKRRPSRGDGGVVEVVRHRSDVGNRL